MTAKKFLKTMDWEKESEHDALPDWYGIEGIKFIWHNEWADPEIEYKGERCSCYIIEDTMWERYKEDDLSDPEEFGRYMLENADEVRELCELALFGY